MPKKILQQNEKVLRKIAKEIPLSQIKTPKIKKILREMSGALKSQDDGVALAAPQVGYSLRIFIVSGKIFAKDFAAKRPPRPETTPPSQGERIKDLVFINPKISKLSREKEWVPEGWLSVRGV